MVYVKEFKIIFYCWGWGIEEVSKREKISSGLV